MYVWITLFGHWFENSVVVSAAALLLSLLAYIRAVGAKPSLIMSVRRHATSKEAGTHAGDVLVVYNAGRKGTLITHAGIRLPGTELFNPIGVVDGISAADTPRPMKLDPGEVALFPFRPNLGPDYEPYRDSRGYEIRYLVPRSPIRWTRTKTARVRYKN